MLASRFPVGRGTLHMVTLLLGVLLWHALLLRMPSSLLSRVMPWPWE